MRSIKIYYFVIILNFIFINQALAQIGGVINSYARVNAISGNDLSIDNIFRSPAEASLLGTFGAGRKVLVIQMKGATIETNNDPSFGTVSNLGNAGNYEVATILNVVDLGPSLRITLDGLTNSYDVAGAMQIVSVPIYNNVSIDTDIQAIDWDPALGRGGIVIMEVQGTLTLNASIDVSGQGFRGGSFNAQRQATCNNFDTYVAPDFQTSTGQRHAQKGESIADYTFNGIAGMEYGRGRIVTAGGGGNSHNGGGGGGGNHSPGGDGGIGWLGGGACTSANVAAGIGGANLNYTPASQRLFMGAGGGGGQQNNSRASVGGNGGGIIIIQANEITNTCGPGLYANGTDAPDAPGNDGAGGGGGGGVILLEVNSFNLSCTLEASVHGGNGGDVNTGNQHGGGGGGGLGAILMNIPPPTQANFWGIPGNPGQDCFTCSTTGGSGGALADVVVGGWSINRSSGSLPVELSKFQVSLNNTQKVNIVWTTTLEKDASHFEIERSSDLKKINVLGRVEAVGNSTQSNNYSWVDEQPLAGNNFYRIKSVDQDSTYEYSEWKSIYLASEGDFTLTPNPSIDFVKIVYESKNNQESTLQCFGPTGNLIKEEKFINSLVLDLQNQSPGIYLIKIISPSGLLIKRLNLR